MFLIAPGLAAFSKSEGLSSSAEPYGTGRWNLAALGRAKASPSSISVLRQLTSEFMKKLQFSLLERAIENGKANCRSAERASSGRSDPSRVSPAVNWSSSPGRLLSVSLIRNCPPTKAAALWVLVPPRFSGAGLAQPVAKPCRLRPGTSPPLEVWPNRFRDQSTPTLLRREMRLNALGGSVDPSTRQMHTCGGNSAGTDKDHGPFRNFAMAAVRPEYKITPSQTLLSCIRRLVGVDKLLPAAATFGSLRDVDPGVCASRDGQDW